MNRFTAGLFLLVSLLFTSGIQAAPAYVQWGQQMMQEKKYDQAIQYFGAAARADNKDAAAYKGLGYAFAYKNDRAKALDYLNYALKLNPKDAELAAYVEQLQGGAQSPAKIEESQSNPAAESTLEAAPENNPWIMGGTVALVGTLMLLAF